MTLDDAVTDSAPCWYEPRHCYTKQMLATPLGPNDIDRLIVHASAAS